MDHDADFPQRAELVRELKRGSHDAISEIFMIVWPDLVKLARCIAPHGMAEDAANDGFLLGLKKIKDRRAPDVTNLRGWFRRATILVSLALRRRERRRKCISLHRPTPAGEDTGNLADLIADPKTVSAADQLDRMARRQVVRTVIEAETGTDRQVVLMRVFDEMTFEQIADRLGISTTTVWRKYQQFCSQLQAALGG